MLELGPITLVREAITLDELLYPWADESLLLPAWDGLDPHVDLPQRSIVNAWEVTLELLARDLPRDVYRRYLAGLRPLRFEPAGRRLIVPVNGERAARFLQARFARVIEKKLQGGIYPPVKVVFTGTRTASACRCPGAAVR